MKISCVKRIPNAFQVPPASFDHTKILAISEILAGDVELMVVLEARRSARARARAHALTHAGRKPCARRTNNMHHTSLKKELYAHSLIAGLLSFYFMWSLAYGMRSHCLSDAGLSFSSISLLVSLQSHYHLVTSLTDPQLRERGVYIHTHKTQMLKDLLQQWRRSAFEWLWLHLTPVEYPSLKFALKILLVLTKEYY